MILIWFWYDFISCRQDSDLCSKRFQQNPTKPQKRNGKHSVLTHIKSSLKLLYRLKSYHNHNCKTRPQTNHNNKSNLDHIKKIQKKRLKTLHPRACWCHNSINSSAIIHCFYASLSLSLVTVCAYTEKRMTCGLAGRKPCWKCWSYGIWAWLQPRIILDTGVSDKCVSTRCDRGSWTKMLMCKNAWSQQNTAMENYENWPSSQVSLKLKGGTRFRGQDQSGITNFEAVAASLPTC
jgi:hypothetical protein